MPGICGIALERERCRADFRIVQQFRGSDPTDAAFDKWLETGDISRRPKDWNGSYIPDKAWAAQPSFSWWYTAGAISIALVQPKMEPGFSEYLGHYVDELARHRDAGPPEYAALISAEGTPYDRARTLQRQLDAATPVVPYPVPAFGNGVVAEARLGIYLATLQQLVDNPLALSRPESRAFATVVLDALESRHHRFSDGLSVAPLLAAVQSDIPTSPQDLDALWREPIAQQTVNDKWPIGPRMALVLGQVIPQVAYNAAVLKDTQSDAMFRGVLAKLPRWSGMSQRLRSDLVSLQARRAPTDDDSWDAINGAASRTTLDLLREP